MLPTSKIILGDEPGDNFLVQGFAAGNIFNNCSTSDPVDTRSVGLELQQRGVRMLDASVGGGWSSLRCR